MGPRIQNYLAFASAVGAGSTAAADIVYQDLGTTIGLGDSIQLQIGAEVGLDAYMTFIAENSIASNVGTFGWLAMDYGNGDNYIDFDGFIPLVPTSSGLLRLFNSSTDIGGPDFNGLSLAFGAINRSGDFIGDWAADGESIRGFAGFKLSENRGNDPGYYGWIDISWSNTGLLTIHGYAYNDVLNATIHAGDVPAPGALGLLGLAAGASGIRRKRND